MSTTATQDWAVEVVKNAEKDLKAKLESMEELGYEIRFVTPHDHRGVLSAALVVGAKPKETS